MTFMWLPWRYPVPEGWQVVEQRLCHHHRWARLIVKCDG